MADQVTAPTTIYIFTALAVLAAYALLLMISMSYIKVVIIPVVMLVFIGAAHSKLKVRLQSNRVDETNKKLVPWVALTFVLQLMQLLYAPMAKVIGQQNDSFAISHFLLFFSSALGSLTVMIATVPVRSRPGVTKVSQVFSMTFTIVLLMSVHTIAAEWVGEDIVLVCMPELIAGLAWFITIHFDKGRDTIDNVTKYGVTILSAAVALLSFFTLKFAYERRVLDDWYARVFGSCTISGVLSLISMYMIHQRSGRTNTMAVPIQLLKFSVYICFGISAILVPMRTGLEISIIKLAVVYFAEAALTILAAIVSSLLISKVFMNISRYVEDIARYVQGVSTQYNRVGSKITNGLFETHEFQRNRTGISEKSYMNLTENSSISHEKHRNGERYVQGVSNQYNWVGSRITNGLFGTYEFQRNRTGISEESYRNFTENSSTSREKHMNHVYGGVDDQSMNGDQQV